MLTCTRADVEDAEQLIDAKAETLFFEGMVSTTPVPGGESKLDIVGAS